MNWCAKSIEQQCATYTPHNVMLLMTEAPTPNIAYNNYSHTAYNCPPNITTKPHQRVNRTIDAEINRENIAKIQFHHEYKQPKNPQSLHKSTYKNMLPNYSSLPFTWATLDHPTSRKRHRRLNSVTTYTIGKDVQQTAKHIEARLHK